MPPAVKPGIDVFLEDFVHLVDGARVGLITNFAAVDASGVPTLERLARDPRVRLAALFGPEHGIYGVAQAGDPVEDARDPRTGLVVFSLYGKTKKITPDMASQVDVFVIDLPDIGCRYWTHLYTMAYALEAAAEHGRKAIVLDRPNPVTGLAPEGNLLDRRFSSFVGEYPIPNRTGLTFGEAARLFNGAFGIGADLTVVPVRGWSRSMWFSETRLLWALPSPNMPTPTTALLYPGTCLIEGTNLSEGRGTTKPFELIGAPWLDPHALAAELNGRALPGVYFRPTYFTPAFQKHQGKTCGGVQVHVTDRDAVRPVRVGLHLLDAVRRLSGGDFRWLEPGERNRPYFIDLLAGTDSLRAEIDAGEDPDGIWKAWNAQLESYLPLRAQAALYPDASLPTPR